MAESDKPGFLGRLFGRKAETSADMPRHTGASESEGAPDLTTAAAAGELPAVEPSVASASPETRADEKPPVELKGADLQPVEGRDPEGGGPKEPIPRAEPEPAGPAKANWWGRLTEGLRRTSSSLSESVTSLFTKRKLDAATLEELEDALIQADLGVATAARIVKAVSQGRYDKEVAPGEVKAILATEVEKVLEPVAKPLAIDRAKKPFVVLMIGVNGSGKTTTIGKLAAKFRAQGLSVMLAAGDTFRAAAIEQLKVWGERTGAPVLAREQGADAAGLAFDALQAARENGIDVLLVDTAGRLQNKAGLMAEL